METRCEIVVARVQWFFRSRTVLCVVQETTEREKRYQSRLRGRKLDSCSLFSCKEEFRQNRQRNEEVAVEESEVSMTTASTFFPSASVACLTFLGIGKHCLETIAKHPFSRRQPKVESPVSMTYSDVSVIMVLQIKISIVCQIARQEPKRLKAETKSISITFATP
jgi:hypothetical protein